MFPNTHSIGNLKQETELAENLMTQFSLTGLGLTITKYPKDLPNLGKAAYLPLPRRALKINFYTNEIDRQLSYA